MDTVVSKLLPLLTLISCILQGNAQVLTPPYFNLAYGKPITATSTCGDGVSEPELYCKLTGANPEDEELQASFSLIQGQLCDTATRRTPAPSARTRLPRRSMGPSVGGRVRPSPGACSTMVSTSQLILDRYVEILGSNFNCQNVKLCDFKLEACYIIVHHVLNQCNGG